jgi:uncharacterized protein YrrD
VRKGKSIIGKDVLSLEDGVKLETVSDVVIDPEGRRLVAIVVTEGGFMSSSKVVATDEVTSYGKDAVVVRNGASVVSVADHPDLRSMVDHDEKILGKKVFTSNGDEQGSISDIYFDEPTGAIVGYEVSGGLLGDAAKGTSYLATDEITSIGKEVVFVPPEAAAVLEAQVGGIQGAVLEAGDKLGQVAGGSPRKPTSGQPDRGNGSLQAQPEDALVGKRTGSDVESDQGSVIVPKGRRIRPEDVAAAKEAGKLPALSASAATGTAQAVGADAADALGSVGDSAANLWDQFMAKIGDMTDATGKRADEEQTKRRLSEISDAVGRPVTKVILDREDTVVLNLGDIITHQAIQRAYESGGLDSLLASAYKGTVEFDKEEMRAPAEAEAQATVEKASGGAVIVDDLEGKVEDAEKGRQAEKERKKQEADAARETRKKEREARATDRENEQAARKSPVPEKDPSSSGARVSARVPPEGANAGTS